MAENRGRFYPSAGGKMHGGTGVFLPLPRLRGDWGRGQTIGMSREIESSSGVLGFYLCISVFVLFLQE